MNDVNDTRALSADPLPLGERLLRVFVSPTRVFRAIPDGGAWPDWVLPVLLAAVFWAAHNATTLSVVAPEEASQLPGWEEMSEERREMAARGLEEWRAHGWFTMPVMASLSSLAIMGLVILGLAKWVLRADVQLRQALALKAYATLVTIPQWILLTPLVRAGDTDASPHSFSPGALLPASMDVTPVGRFLSALTVFDAWQGVVIGLGLAVMSGQPPRRAVGVILGFWVAWLALGALMPVPSPEAAGP